MNFINFIQMNFARKFSFRLESIKNYFRNICFSEFRKFGNKQKKPKQKTIINII